MLYTALHQLLAEWVLSGLSPRLKEGLQILIAEESMTAGSPHTIDPLPVGPTTDGPRMHTKMFSRLP